MPETLLVLEWKLTFPNQPLHEDEAVTVSVVQQDDMLRGAGCLLAAVGNAVVQLRSCDYPEWVPDDPTLYVRGESRHTDNKTLLVRLGDLQLIAVSVARFNGRKNVVDPLKSGPGRIL